MRSGVPFAARGRLTGWLVGLAWAFVVVGGFVALTRYEVSPGAEAVAPTALEQALRGSAREVVRTPVFGCALLDPPCVGTPCANLEAGCLR